jgi:hypothetical protein
MTRARDVNKNCGSDTASPPAMRLLLSSAIAICFCFGSFYQKQLIVFPPLNYHLQSNE